MDELIKEIDLSDYRDKFENIHDFNFDDNLYYHLIHNEKALEVEFKVSLSFYNGEIDNIEIDIKELNIWVNGGIKIEVNYPTILKVEQKILEQLKELY